MFRVLTIGILASALIACGFITNETPTTQNPTEVATPIAR